MTETEKLQNAAEMIDTLSKGGFAFKTGMRMNPFLYCVDENLLLGLQMNNTPDIENGGRNVSFSAYFVTELGKSMDFDALLQLGEEVWRMRSLLGALETQTYAPSEDEFNAFNEWLVRREEQSQGEIELTM